MEWFREEQNFNSIEKSHQESHLIPSKCFYWTWRFDIVPDEGLRFWVEALCTTKVICCKKTDSLVQAKANENVCENKIIDPLDGDRNVINAKHTPVVCFMAIAAFDLTHQWPLQFTQMYWPKEILLIYTSQTCDKTLLTTAKTGVNCWMGICANVGMGGVTKECECEFFC